MSNILSVNASAPFSAQSLDANSVASDELDPRFVEELQGAMGLVEHESAPQSATQDTSSPQEDTSDNEVTPGLQNLPLMPWAMINVPANFAPQEAANAGAAADSRAVDALAAASAVEARAVDGAALSMASAMPSIAGAVGTVDGANPVANGSPASLASAPNVVNSVVTAEMSQDSTPVTASDAMSLASVSAAAPSQAQRAEGQLVDVGVAQMSASLPTQTQVESAVTSRVDVTSKRTAGMTSDTTVLSTTVGSQQQATRAVAAGAVMTTGMPVVAQSSSAASDDHVGLSNTPGGTGVSAQAPVVQDDASVAASQRVTAVQTPSAPAEGSAAMPVESVAVASTQQTTSNETASAPVTSQTQTPSTPSLSSDQAVTRVAASAASEASALVAASPERTASQPVTAVEASVVTASAHRVAAATTDVAVQVAAAGTSAVTGPVGSGLPVTQHLDSRDDALAQRDQEHAGAQMPEVSTDTAITVPVTAVNVTSSTSTSSTVEAAKTESSATTSSTLAGVSGHKGQAEFIHGSDGETPTQAVSSEASAASSLTLNGSTLETLGSGASGRAGGTAESTFASSFVQALMGHAHPSVAPHSQALEVVPAPAPIAPHQVRFDAGQVQVEVVRLVKQGGGQVVMELTPPDESKFKIDLSINPQGVARLVVDGASESTRLRLEQTVSGLQDQFQQMGLQLQLDMRQPRQHEAHTQPDAATTPDVPSTTTNARSDTVALQPVTGRPAWEQGQVYLVA